MQQSDSAPTVQRTPIDVPGLIDAYYMRKPDADDPASAGGRSAHPGIGGHLSRARSTRITSWRSVRRWSSTGQGRVFTGAAVPGHGQPTPLSDPARRDRPGSLCPRTGCLS